MVILNEKRCNNISIVIKTIFYTLTNKVSILLIYTLITFLTLNTYTTILTRH
jgi:hypothetical protein